MRFEPVPGSHFKSSAYVPHRLSLRADQETVGHWVGDEGFRRGHRRRKFAIFSHFANQHNIIIPDNEIAALCSNDKDTLTKQRIPNLSLQY